MDASLTNNMQNCNFSVIILVYLLVIALACKPSKSMMNLTPQQVKIYEMVKSERLALFSVGIFSGAVISSLFVMNLNVLYPKCTIFSLTYLFASLVYTVIPKTTYMMYHLKDDEQKKKWMYIYDKMKITNSLFFTLAVVSLIIKV